MSSIIQIRQEQLDNLEVQVYNCYELQRMKRVEGTLASINFILQAEITQKAIGWLHWNMKGDW